MAVKNVVTPYTTARKLINTADIPTWLNAYDAERISSYALYENIYWTNPQTFKLQQRGNEENPIYIPSGRIIVNTMDRYTGPDWMPIMDPGAGTPEEQAAAYVAFRDLFARERLGSQYDANKLFGIMRGDWIWYITGNMEKPQGRRIKIRAIDPSQVFPINDEDDVDIILGYDLVEQVPVGSDLRIKRTRYLKSEHPDHIGGTELPGGPIQYQVDTLEVQNWEDPANQKFVNSDLTVPPTLFPPSITTPPIYHIKNFEEPQNPFGSSEMRGIERIMAAVNQSITDEELSLALEGLGMYKTSSGRPVDANGNPTTWQLGPGRVVHDGNFERVNGINTVGPYQEHLKYLHSQIDGIFGTGDVAKGIADVSVAESGIALAIKMGPILTSAKRKDRIISEVMDNMLYDLRAWFKEYEKVDMTNVRFNSKFGSKMPENKKERFDELYQMYTATPPLITGAYFRDACREMGIDIPIDVNGAAIAAEQASLAAAVDPYGVRLAGEEDPNVQIPNDGSDFEGQ